MPEALVIDAGTIAPASVPSWARGSVGAKFRQGALAVRTGRSSQCVFDRQGSEMKIKIGLISVLLALTVSSMACTESMKAEQVTQRSQALSPDIPVDQVTLCGALLGAECPADAYCRAHDGVCGEVMLGWCAPLSEFCTADVAPVCGCDGETYSNECQMMSAGVSLDHMGACVSGCTSNDDCGPSGVCDIAGCGDEAEAGKCLKAPKICNRMWAPVCGCDGETYANDCRRLKAGVGLAHEGPCVTPCGGFAGLMCDEGEICYYPEGTCEWADHMGMCEAPPKFCPKNIDPVCGCDGESYRNACMMKRAGVSMSHKGLCCAPLACLIGEPIDSDDDGCADTCPTPLLCEGPNPQGCVNTGCDEGESCIVGMECTASTCFCDGQVGAWLCTKDCGGGTCVPDDEPVDLCADFEQPGCVQSGCDAGFVCDTSVGCVPSACGCDSETGAVMCTADCGGGTCVPEQGPLQCEEPNPQACTPGSCPDGSTCDLSQGCEPSHCACTDIGGEAHWNCTKDCVPGVCIPDAPQEGCCIKDLECGAGELCVNGESALGGVCKPIPPPAFPAISCWSDAGCPAEETCLGATVCPCGAQCFAPDAPGICTGGDALPGVPESPEESE